MRPTRMIAVALSAALSLVLTGCASSSDPRPPALAAPHWALAIHGGAGVMANLSQEEQAARLDSLRTALNTGREILRSGGTALDACEQVVRTLEDDPLFNAGKGAVFTEAGTHELDAAIMDGATLNAGAIAGARTVRHPVSLARLVMARTRHVMLAGAGVEAFADECAVERVPNEWFDTPAARRELERVLEERRRKQALGDPDPSDTRPSARMSTVGCVALDRAGNLAAATSTGGLTGKRWGRVGDVPIIGAGTYARNDTAAISCTGVGEQFIRHTVAREVAALMQYKGLSAGAAAEQLIFRTLGPDDGGLIVVGRSGEIAMVFSTPGMARGAADSSGRFEVGLYNKLQP